MITYFPYDPENPQSVIGEQHTIERGQIRLRHVPTEHSIQIEGFSEVSSPAALHLNEFACLYSRETGYREANRIVYFSSAHNGLTIYVNYLACGTPLTADDANEIKAHIDSSVEKDLLNEVSHRQFSNDILALRNSIAAAQSDYQLPTASANVKGGVKIGRGLTMTGEILSADAQDFTLQVASSNVLGGVKIGNGLAISDDGVLNVTISGGEITPTIKPEGMDFLTYVFRNRPPAEYNSLGKQDFLSYVLANDTPTVYSEGGGVSKADFIDYVFGGASNG
ncbi:MAG: hypothetical protein J5497_04460 [Selenomonadaceae bacterium]|nr:hypothetical protein [Selenomonadaceae bacterium]